jgi:hypothetical protein
MTWDARDTSRLSAGSLPYGTVGALSEQALDTSHMSHAQEHLEGQRATLALLASMSRA